MKALDYVLKSILDMDKKARSQKQDAESYRREVFDKIDFEKQQIIKAELEAAHIKIKSIDDGFKKGADGRIKVISQQFDVVVAELFKKQEQNGDLWIGKLYERVLK